MQCRSEVEEVEGVVEVAVDFAVVVAEVVVGAEVVVNRWIMGRRNMLSNLAISHIRARIY